MKIGRLFGIPIHIGWSFLVLTAVVGIIAMRMPEPGMLLAQFGIVFAAVAIHEFGHALVARAVGVRVHGITFNFMVALTHMDPLDHRDPRREMGIIAAGPLANLVLGCLLLPLAVLTFEPAANGGFALLEHGLATFAVAINFILAVFNLLPGLPMDGGMLLRSALTKRMGRVSATNLAASIGTMLAVVMAVLGIFMHIFWLFLAVYIWLGAQRERMRTAAIERMREAGMGGVPPELAMLLQGLGMTPDKVREMMNSSRGPRRGSPPAGTHSPWDPQGPSGGPGTGGAPGANGGRQPDPDDVVRQMEIDLGRLFGAMGGQAGSGPRGPRPSPGADDSDQPRRVHVEIVNVETNQPESASGLPDRGDDAGEGQDKEVGTGDGTSTTPDGGTDSDAPQPPPDEGHFKTRDGRHFYKGQELL